MTRIGLILCGYGTRDLIDRALAPWLSLRMNPAYDIRICAVSVKFAGFEGEDDGTRERLRWYLENREIDHLVDGPDNVPEVTARGMALHWLVDQGCGLSWMVDSDELYERPQIHRILDFVTANPFAAWFRLSLANYVFDERTRLIEPFTPPRIHRVRVDGYRVHSFSADNDIAYGGTITRDIIPQDRFPSMTVPEPVAAIKHLSWPNSPRGKVKQAYQAARWGSQVCSFAWDDAQGGLIFNPALPRPRVVRE